MVEEQCPKVAELMASPLAKYITIAADDCGYSVTTEELIVKYVHPFLKKSRPATSQEDNLNWCEATTGVFSELFWKAMKV